MYEGTLSACALLMRRAPSASTVFALTAIVAATVQTYPIATAPPQVAPTGAVTPSHDLAGNAIVDVTIVDRFGAPLDGVTVKLAGVVNREAVSNDVGFVMFGALPEGRYDVVASMKGMAPSAPRVFDLPAFGVTSVAVTLKPHAERSLVSQACGGFDPRSIRTASTSAHLVLHVKVTDQHTLELERSTGDPSDGLATLNSVQMLQSFKPSLRAPMVGSIVTIRQGGGRIDRGESIFFHHSNDLPPLNIGDEYVLFVYIDAGGTYWIVGSEEGVFRVRNGRVDPLGRGGAASTWRGRSVARFFQALRALP